MRINGLIDPKKKQRVREAIEKGDTSIFVKKKAEPEPTQRKPVGTLVENKENKAKPKPASSQKAAALIARAHPKFTVRPLLTDEEHEKLGFELIAAAKKGNLDRICKAIHDGVDLDFKNKDGWTALMWAAGKGYLEAAELLIGSGAAIDAQNRFKETALARAAISCGSAPMVKMLIEKGASPNLADKDGNTPLMHAVMHKHGGAVDEFIRGGADTCLVNNQGKSALDLAREAHLHWIVSDLVLKAPKKVT